MRGVEFQLLQRTARPRSRWPSQELFSECLLTSHLNDGRARALELSNVPTARSVAAFSSLRCAAGDAQVPADVYVPDLCMAYDH